MKLFIYKTKFSDGGASKLATAPRENCLKQKRLKLAIHPSNCLLALPRNEMNFANPLIFIIGIFNVMHN